MTDSALGIAGFIGFLVFIGAMATHFENLIRSVCMAVRLIAGIL